MNSTLSHKQEAILAFPYSRKYKHLICEGAIRSGKSSLMSVAFIEWAMRNFNGQNFIILGYTIGSVLRNVVDPLRAMMYMRRRYRMSYNGGKSVLTVERGGSVNQFLIFGADTKRAYEKIQGLTAAGCLVDEVALCERNAVDIALSRCSVDNSRYFFNCNPDTPKHWFYTDWILQAEKHDALRLHLTMDDNPSLSEEVKSRFRDQYHGVFYDRYILGEWVVAEGLVYQFDSPDEYVCSHEEAMGDKAGEWFVSLDYGITNPFAALLWRITRDKAYVVDEYYFSSAEQGRRRTDEEHYKALDRFINLSGIDIVIDPSASSFKETIWRHGKYSAIDADNSVLSGIQTVDLMLHDGSVKISDTCTNLLKEMQLYRWDDKAARDAVVKENDHCVTGDTLIATEHGEIPIAELVGTSGKVWSYDGSKAVLKPFNDVRMTREFAEVFEITTNDGRTLKCTADHKIMTERGWVECRYLMPSDRIISLDGNVGISGIRKIGIEPVYNMEVEDTHCFAANGLIVHNCEDALRYGCVTKVKYLLEQY